MASAAASSSRHAFKNALVRFMHTRDLQDLFKTSCTFGLGILFKYLRGYLKNSEFHFLKVFTQRLRKFLGLLLPKCHRVPGTEMTPQKEKDIQESEDHIVNHVLNALETSSKTSKDQLDGPPPPSPEQWFAIQSLSSREKEEEEVEERFARLGFTVGKNTDGF